MASVRICAVLTLGVLAIYHMTRLLAAQCSGPRCKAYIGNVLIFALAVTLAVLTGVLGSVAAARRRQGGWRGFLIGCTVVGLLVPVIGLVVLRKSPDTFVVATTTVSVLIPVVALIYGFVPLRLRDQA